MQMSLWRIVTVSVISIIAVQVRAADNQGTGVFRGVLGYTAGASKYPRALLLKSPTEGNYRLSLIPEFDVRKHVVNLELFLERSDEKGNGQNLLDVTGRLHGYQPYYFAASDFARGAQKSTYGDVRVIDVPRLKLELRTKIIGVSVEPIDSDAPRPLSYQFDRLNLEIISRGG